MARGSPACVSHSRFEGKYQKTHALFLQEQFILLTLNGSREFRVPKVSNSTRTGPTLWGIDSIPKKFCRFLGNT